MEHLEILINFTALVCYIRHSQKMTPKRVSDFRFLSLIKRTMPLLHKIYQ